MSNEYGSEHALPSVFHSLYYYFLASLVYWNQSHDKGHISFYDKCCSLKSQYKGVDE